MHCVPEMQQRQDAVLVSKSEPDDQAEEENHEKAGKQRLQDLCHPNRGYQRCGDRHHRRADLPQPWHNYRSLHILFNRCVIRVAR
jgi:hypothetical protein